MKIKRKNTFSTLYFRFRLVLTENMRYIIAVLVVLVAIGTAAGLGAMTDAVKDFRTDLVTDSFVVTTNTTAINGTAQLTKVLWEGQTTEAAITSNITSDTPALTEYTAGNRNLAFTGLAANTTRLITVEYRTFDLGAFPGADTAVKFIPMAILMGLIFVPLISVVMVVLGR